MQRSCTETRASTEGVLMAPELGQRLPPASLRLALFPMFLHFSALSLERQRGGGIRNLGQGRLVWLSPFWITRRSWTRPWR